MRTYSSPAQPSRRVLLRSAGAAPAALPSLASQSGSKAVVGNVRIRNGNVDCAVEALLGGTRSDSAEANLVSPRVNATAKPPVVKSLAGLMKSAGKDVSNGERSAAAVPFTHRGAGFFRPVNPNLLNRLRQHLYDRLGNTELAASLHVTLVNLHTGELVERDLPAGFVFKGSHHRRNQSAGHGYGGREPHGLRSIRNPRLRAGQKGGMRPERLDEIEVRGESVESGRRKFVRPQVSPWDVVRKVWATRGI